MDRDEARQAALEQFCIAEFGRLVRMLSLYCGDRQTAEDLAQETLARVWRRWDRVSGLEAPELWARRVALNLARSWARRQRLARRTAPLASWVSRADTDGLVSDAAFVQMIGRLAPRQRAVLILRFYEDRSVAETARLLGVREGTVRALCSQAVAGLRRQGAAISGSDDE